MQARLNLRELKGNFVTMSYIILPKAVQQQSGQIKPKGIKREFCYHVIYHVTQGSATTAC